MSYRLNAMQSGGFSMESVSVERLDHLGVVASVIKDLGLIEMIDARLLVHDQEEITAGEAVAGMILNGLGFSDRPLTLTPQFFANKPLDLLFREGVDAEMFNRFKLGRTLGRVGCERGHSCLFSQPPPEPDVILSHHPALRFPSSLFDLGLLWWMPSWHLRQTARVFRFRAIMICIQYGFSFRPFFFRSASFRIWCMCTSSLAPQSSHVS